MEESGQESGNVDKIQHHQKPPRRLPTVDSSHSGSANSREPGLAGQGLVQDINVGKTDLLFHRRAESSAVLLFIHLLIW